MVKRTLLGKTKRKYSILIDMNIPLYPERRLQPQRSSLWYMSERPKIVRGFQSYVVRRWKVASFPGNNLFVVS